MLEVLENGTLFHLCTGEVSYLIQAEGDSVRGLHFGAPVDAADAPSLLTPDFHSSFDTDLRAEREEYPLWNGHSFHLPGLRARGESGRAVFCVYKGFEREETQDADRLDLILEDAAMGLTVTLRYVLYRQYGILARSAVLTAAKELTLERAMSASVSLPPAREYKARWLTGKWSGEFRMQESPVRTGVLTLQGRRGVTGHHFSPAIALAEPDADENGGGVWFGALGYSGNWSVEVEKTIFGNTHIVAGINDFDFEAPLSPGQSFETPIFYTGYTPEGYGGMSRAMHRFVRERVMPRQNLRPVLYNSWEATSFHVRAEEQKKLAERAAGIGCELFVVDDGWFGARDSDQAGLGDWRVNPEKFPRGLGELADHVKGLGMRFGIWVEPESVNPDSELYRAHPDWIYRYPDEEPLQLRNQYLLNMSLPAVREYLRAALHDLLSGSGVTFVKWDMNRALTDPHSIPDGAGKTLWHSHVEAVYGLWQGLREQFPEVELETCSGGGARVDLGILRYAEQSWPSDNTDPYTRLFIQEGYTQFYPPLAMMSWVTSSPDGRQWADRPIAYRFHSAMCGGLGIGSDITKLSEAELGEYAEWIRRYKQWRHIVQKGALYRLLSPREGRLSAVEYVAEDGNEALVFLFASGLATDEPLPTVRLRGLDGGARYLLDGGGSLAGSTLMNAGLRPELSGDFASRVIYLVRC